MAPDYRIATATIDGTFVRIYTRPGGLSSAALLAAARPALQRFADRLGAYPYGEFTIAESAGGWAMEGPGVIWIPRGTSTSRFRYLVSHEIAHQWFYGIVGNDQPAQPFADEAVADFLTRWLLGSWRSPRCAPGTFDHSIYYYSSSCFYETVYVQGAGFLDYIRSRMGDTAFWGALRAHVTAERFDIARSQDLLGRLDAATPLDLRPLFERRFPLYY
jgi:hypothetical protein